MSQRLSEVMHIEQLKQHVDYAKNMAALSTGSLLLLGTLVEKAFPHPKFQALIAVSFGGFLAAVVASVVAHTMLVIPKQHFEDQDPPLSGAHRSWSVAVVCMWASFLWGVIPFGLFAIANYASR
jgi:hypothetical protein